MGKTIKERVDQMTYEPSFQRRVDKAQIPTINILGSEILVGSMDSLLDYVETNLEALSGDYIMVTASKELLLAYDDRDFYRCQNGGVLAIPDGGPLRTYGRLHGRKEMERITGPDLMLRMLERSRQTGWTHFFYGSTQETLDRMRERIGELYPGVRIAGMEPSLFRDLTEEEDREIVARINGSEADLVWLCLGAPKSSYFAAEHQGRLRGLTVSVGAGFDYLAGNIDRAPSWMQRLDLEWLYRVLQEPGRLLMRYLTTVPRFLWLAYLFPGARPSFLREEEQKEKKEQKEREQKEKKENEKKENEKKEKKP